MWLLAIISLKRWGTPTFLAFPDLPRPRTLIRLNLVTGTIFWYFWCGIIQPQLTVPSHQQQQQTQPDFGNLTQLQSPTQPASALCEKGGSVISLPPPAPPPPLDQGTVNKELIYLA